MNEEEKKTLKLIEDSLNKKCNGLECKVVKNNIDLRLENIRLKRQIDLMANYIVNLIKYNNPEEIREVEEIKQYFENKVTDTNVGERK